MTVQVDQTLDAKGMACPMPIVHTKKSIEKLQPGQVLEIQATDQGSLADIQGWARSTGHEYLGTKEEVDVLKHYVRKSHPEETQPETKHPHVIKNDELLEKINQGNAKVLDVREPAEYSFGRIPNAQAIPYGELENRLDELNPDDDIHVVCRTGRRSDLASQLLAEKGFKHVKNVVPGMSEWEGPIEKD